MHLLAASYACNFYCCLLSSCRLAISNLKQSRVSIEIDVWATSGQPLDKLLEA